MPKQRARHKAGKAHQYITRAYLTDRQNAYELAGYPVAKWMIFCQWALDYGLLVFLHESHSTVSKYIYISKTKDGPRYKVRFSNHRPNYRNEVEEDCDFFVGVTNTGVRTTDMAIAAATQWVAKDRTIAF